MSRFRHNDNNVSSASQAAKPPSSSHQAYTLLFRLEVVLHALSTTSSEIRGGLCTPKSPEVLAAQALTGKSQKQKWAVVQHSLIGRASRSAWLAATFRAEGSLHVEAAMLPLSQRQLMSRDITNPHPKPLSMGLVVSFYLFMVALAALGLLTDLKDAASLALTLLLALGGGYVALTALAMAIESSNKSRRGL